MTTWPRRYNCEHEYTMVESEQGKYVAASDCEMVILMSNQLAQDLSKLRASLVECACGHRLIDHDEHGCMVQVKTHSAIGGGITFAHQCRCREKVKDETIATPVEKRCGTCLHWTPYDDGTGACEADFPAACTDQEPMEPEHGSGCPCWKARR